MCPQGEYCCLHLIALAGRNTGWDRLSTPALKPVAVEEQIHELTLTIELESKTIRVH